MLRRSDSGDILVQGGRKGWPGPSADKNNVGLKFSGLAL